MCEIIGWCLCVWERGLFLSYSPPSISPYLLIQYLPFSHHQFQYQKVCVCVPVCVCVCAYDFSLRFTHHFSVALSFLLGPFRCVSIDDVSLVCVCVCAYVCERVCARVLLTACCCWCVREWLSVFIAAVCCVFAACPALPRPSPLRCFPFGRTRVG